MKSKKVEFITEIISNGRITIPSHVRKHLKLKNGDSVKIILSKEIEEILEVEVPA